MAIHLFFFFFKDIFSIIWSVSLYIILVFILDGYCKQKGTFLGMKTTNLLLISLFKRQTAGCFPS